ncbi:MAG: hypothetical protein ACRDSM_10815 [Pseudonocardiaceae bacterium]
MHNPPRLTGSSRPVNSIVPSSRPARLIPHCNEQYGQFVAIGPAVTPSSLGERCYQTVVE